MSAYGTPGGWGVPLADRFPHWDKVVSV